MSDIVVHSLSKAYDGKPVLQNVSLRFPGGRVSCLMAPSGTGKTTLLRILAGLTPADSGSVEGLEALQVGMVFQENRLLPQLSALDNVRLVCPHLSRSALTEAFAAMGLTDAMDKKARDLSGGMARRVALLRALLSDADVLLLDEPFGGLDKKTRKAVAQACKDLLRGRTCILVTHDPKEPALMDAKVLTL